MVSYNGLGRTTGNIEFLPNGDTETRGWHMVSNPYPSPITISAADLNAMGFDAQIHRWNSETGTWESNNPLVATTIAVGQAFQIRKTTVGGLSNFSLNNNFRTTDLGIFYKSNENLNQFLSVTLSNENYSNTSFVYFKEDATDLFDNKYDVNRLYGLNHIPLVYTFSDNQKLAYNALPLLEEDNQVSVPLGVYDGVPGEFSFLFNDLNTLQTENINVIVLLEDLKTSTFTQLSEGSTYTFTTEEDDEDLRFILHFHPVSKEDINLEEETIEEIDDIEEEVLSIGVDSNKVLALYPNPTSSDVKLILTENHQFNECKILDLTGRLILTRPLSYQESVVNINLDYLSKGVYLVQVSTDNEYINFKLIKQ